MQLVPTVPILSILPIVFAPLTHVNNINGYTLGQFGYK